MKIVLIFVAGKSEDYATTAEASYIKKISPIFPFEVRSVKAKAHNRDGAQEKNRRESDTLLAQLEPTDLVWLCDEQGKMPADSRAFSQDLVRGIESGKKRLVFLVGGPYGTSEELKARANKILSLSSLTMNHHLAKVVLLEQIYRALTIWRGIPYHN